MKHRRVISPLPTSLQKSTRGCQVRPFLGSGPWRTSAGYPIPFFLVRAKQRERLLQLRS